MARLDDLIEQVRDPALRQKLADALADMKREQDFGLVFEEHLPETTTLLTMPIREGVIVQRRDDAAGKTLFRVKALGGRGRVTIEPELGGPESVSSAKDLVVVERFGDPVYPALTSLGTVQRGPEDRPHHAIVKGENFHALQLFSYLHRGQVDCVYIDPPYNTGARDWKYNNRFVDKKDGWRHSKWLSMMEKRLTLAKRLLKPDGVLICAIDEHEVHHLGMLLEDIFKDKDYLRHMVTTVINPKGTGKYNFGRVDEYLFFVVPNTGKSIISGIPTVAAATAAAAAQGGLFPAAPTAEAAAAEEEEDEEADDEDELDPADEAEDADDDSEEDEDVPLPFPVEELPLWELRHARRRGGESGYRFQRKNQFYPIYVDPVKKKAVKAGPPLLPVELQPSFAPVDGLLPVWPIDSEGNHRCWRLIQPKMQAKIDGGFLRLGRYNEQQKSWTLNLWVRRSTSKKLKTVWWDTRHDAGTHGTTLLHKVLGARNTFPFPKSLYAVRDAIAAVVRNRKDALILDFFAGSGTTFHATCLLNAEDEGKRRCILVTNNEVADKVARKLRKQKLFLGDPAYEQHGIFEQATRPRCEAVVTGKRPDGAPIPLTHLDEQKTPMSKGFRENVEFFQLDYLNPEDVDLGLSFDALYASLWSAAGGLGKRKRVPAQCELHAPDGSKFAILLDEAAFRKLRALLVHRPEITHVWIATDSEQAFAEMRSALAAHLTVSMLYRDYLRNFRINTRGNL